MSLTNPLKRAPSLNEQEQRNASLRQHIADLEASGAVMEHITLHGCRFCIDRARITVARGTNTGWEGQS